MSSSSFSRLICWAMRGASIVSAMSINVISSMMERRMYPRSCFDLEEALNIQARQEYCTVGKLRRLRQRQTDQLLVIIQYVFYQHRVVGNFKNLIAPVHDVAFHGNKNIVAVLQLQKRFLRFTGLVAE